MIENLASLVELAKNKRKRKIAVAAAGDYHVLEAISNASNQGIIGSIMP